MPLLALLGANGSFGKDAVPLFEAAGYNVARGDLPEVDIADAVSLEAFLDSSRPDIVLNTAAYTRVDDAERERDEAFKANAGGAEIVAKACAWRGLALVHLSTDYVFPGEKPEGYVPNHKPGPTLNVYGESKLAGEMAVRAAMGQSRWMICRTQWLYGLSGANFVETIRRLAAEREELRVVDDQWGAPTSTMCLARQVLHLLENGERGIFHTVGGGGPVTWYDFAKEIVDLTGLPCKVLPCSSEEFPRPAKRPKHGWLKNETIPAKVVGDWRSDLGEYMTQRARK